MKRKKIVMLNNKCSVDKIHLRREWEQEGRTGNSGPRGTLSSLPEPRILEEAAKGHHAPRKRENWVILSTEQNIITMGSCCLGIARAN